MLNSVKQLINDLHVTRVQQEEEIKVLKQRLQHSHTTINDLRFKTRMLEKAFMNMSSNDDREEAA